MHTIKISDISICAGHRHLLKAPFAIATNADFSLSSTKELRPCPHGMKFKAFTLLKNLKLSPERTSMEALTEKRELKQEIRAANGNVFCF